MLMLGIHNLMGTWTNSVDAYVALTEFGRQLFVAGGLPRPKIHIKPHFAEDLPAMGRGSGGYVLYVGRLSEEKGVGVLLEAWEKMPEKPKLLIVGDGPMRLRVVNASLKVPQIQWMGRCSREQVAKLMADALCVMVPSVCYETFGRTIIEAYAAGTPVIACGHGAMAELIVEGQTGRLFVPGDSTSLADSVRSLVSDESQLQVMRGYARAAYEEHYTASRNHNLLMDIYHRAIEERFGAVGRDMVIGMAH
jgi:glycosyltransferase involved in cell wall biosynthesis